MRRCFLVLAAILACAGAAKADDIKTFTPPGRIDTAANTITVGKRVLALPPRAPGCYKHISGAWVATPCLTAAQRAHLIPPDPVTMFQSGFPPTAANTQQIITGDADITVVRYGTETDPQNGGADKFSVQLNASYFTGSNGHPDWVQFVYQSEVFSGKPENILCIWEFDMKVVATATAADPLKGADPEGCEAIDVVRSPQTGDQISITGTATQGSLQLIAVLPWATGSGGAEPDAFSTSTSDEYGLESGVNWNSVDGGLIGAGGRSVANFAKSCVTTDLSFSLADWTISPQPPPYPAVAAHPGGTTGESSNIAPVNGYLGVCVEGTCGATFHGVSSDWKKQGQVSCYPQDTPPPVLSSSSQVYEDDSTKTTMMGESVHICANNGLMIGLDAADDRLLCSTVLPSAGAGSNTNPLIADSSTHATFTYGGIQHSVHVCPTKTVMVGWSKSQNWLICGPSLPSGYVTTPGYGQIVVNGPTDATHVPEPRHSGVTLHACNAKGLGEPMVMSGLEATDNAFICMNAGVVARLQ